MIPFIDELDVADKKVLVRADFNVPLCGGKPLDPKRIEAALPTIHAVLKGGGSVILCSHLGRPQGRFCSKLSLAPVARYLEEKLGKPVHMAPDCIGPAVEVLVESLLPGEILLLENLRFHTEEKAGNEKFGKALAKLCDIYCVEAFATMHRPHASIAVAPSCAKQKCAGFLVQKELKYLKNAMDAPKRPFVAIFAGAKISGKIGIMNHLLSKVDSIIIGGAMANTFLLAKGHDIGISLAESDLVDEARTILKKAEDLGVKLLLPTDVVLGKSKEDTIPAGVQDVGGSVSGLAVFDVGPKSVQAWSEVCREAGTIVWNGPVGFFENPVFATGSLNLAQAVADCRGTTIIGGGETSALFKQADLCDKVSFVSTGGGAFMAFIEGQELPGIKALKG